MATRAFDRALKLPILDDRTTTHFQDQDDAFINEAQGISDAEFLRSKYETPSRNPVLRWTVEGWPVVKEPPLSRMNANMNSLQKALFRAKGFDSSEDLGPLEDLPARACPHCGRPMPTDLGVRELKTLVVIGTVGAGKTHFLASAIKEAYHGQSLHEYGYEAFLPDESTSYRVDEELISEYVSEGKRAGATLPDSFDYRPLCFRFTHHSLGDRRFTVLIHDVPGELLMDQGSRARELPFLRHADGFIFLIDPKYLPAFRSRIKPDRPASAKVGFHQSRLVVDCISELNTSSKGQHEIGSNMSLVISKADILPELLKQSFSFLKDGPSPLEVKEWRNDRAEVIKDVRTVLEMSQASDLLAAADKMGGVLFQAVAPIGSEVAEDAETINLQPIRCTEVLAGALDRMLKIRGRNWLQ